jgi:hypothetical protein
MELVSTSNLSGAVYLVPMIFVCYTRLCEFGFLMLGVMRKNGIVQHCQIIRQYKCMVAKNVRSRFAVR